MGPLVGSGRRDTMRTASVSGDEGVWIYIGPCRMERRVEGVAPTGIWANRVKD